ncbi:MAG: tetratricopeptide repeat protein [bacterium]
MLNEISWTLKEIVDPRSAVEFGEKALKINRTVLSENDPEIARTSIILGYAYDALGEHQKAIDYFAQALAIFTQFFGPEHANSKTVAEWLAACEQ